MGWCSMNAFFFSGSLENLIEGLEYFMRYMGGGFSMRSLFLLLAVRFRGWGRFSSVDGEIY